MQMKDKAKGIQARHAERVERLCKKTSCTLSPKKCNIDIANAKIHELIELSNIIIYIVIVN